MTMRAGLGVKLGLNYSFLLIRYHHNAFFMQKAGETVRNLTYNGFVDFLELVFKNQNGKQNGAFPLHGVSAVAVLL